MNHFLFGNLDESGQLEAEDWNSEIVSSLLVFSAQQGDIRKQLQIDEVDESTITPVVNGSLFAAGKGRISEIAADDAEDFSTIDELATEDDRKSQESVFSSIADGSSPFAPSTRFAQTGIKAAHLETAQMNREEQQPPPPPKQPTVTAALLTLGQNGRPIKFSLLMADLSQRPRTRFNIPRKTRALLPPGAVVWLPVDLADDDGRLVFEKDRQIGTFDQQRAVDGFQFAPTLSKTEKPSMAAAEQAVQDEEQQSAAELKRLMGTGIAEDWRFHPITTSDWESAIVWELPSPPLPVSDEMQQEINQSPPIRRFNQPETRFILPNYDLETGEWEAEIIWDEAQAAMLPLPAVQINLNDPNIVVEVAHEGKQGYLSRIAAQKRRKAAGSKGDKILKKEESKKRSSSSAAKQSATETAAALRSAAADKQSLTLDKFNLSNDRYYEIHKTAKSGLVRQEFGKASVQHSLPALRLSLPFFKVNMSKSDLRAFHRPPLKLISDEMFQFMRLRRFQKSRLRGKQITEILKSPKDITLRDNCPYVLFEYSEEYPPLLSNGGMGSLIMNYYRKKDEKDSFIPKVNLGALSILEQVDASPFFGFGDVQPGQLFQAIKNNLYIAPIFKQELQNDDFLLIRYTYKDSTKYFLRDIPRVFTVGQTFPLTLVHPPQSRKMKVYVRDRLKVTAFRRFLKKGRHIRFPLKRVLNSFHRYHEQSIRKHLRDCFELQGGTFSDNKWLVMRRDAVIPPDEEMFKLVTPEMTCVFESLRVGQQRLADAGYGTGEIQMEDDADQDGESILDDEVQLAPWNTTKNFILATQAKGMIKVYGPGDPTGRGEGFSFFRASMKKMFVRRGTTRAELEAYQQSQEKFGHKFSISDQQKHYKEEINRVWDAQIRSLSSVAELEFDEREAQAGDLLMEGDGGGGGGGQESATDLRDMMQMFEGVGDSSTVGQSQSGGRYSRASSPAPSSQHPASTISRLMAADDTTMETGSVDSSSRMTGGRAKALLIRRKVTNDRGMEEWQEEAVFDYRIINAYMKQKRIMEISAANPEDDEETRKRRLIEQLRMLKRQTGRSLTIPKMSQSNRKCRSCGQIGHILTNRICPNFAINFPEKAKKSAVQEVKAKDGKITIPKAAMEYLEEQKRREQRRKQKKAAAALANAQPTTAVGMAQQSKRPRGDAFSDSSSDSD